MNTGHIDMDFDIKFPLAFRAQPKRTKEGRNVLVTETQRVAVREVSSMDMPIIFETHGAWTNPEGRLDREYRNTLPDLPVDGQRGIRSFEGRMYREIAPDFDYAKRLELFDHAFCVTANRPELDFAGSLSRPMPLDPVWEERLLSQPVSRALYEQIEWALKRDAVGMDPAAYYWPESGHRGAGIGHTGRFATRDGMVMSDVRNRLDHFSERDIEACRDMQAHQAAKLLVVDGGAIWMECTPPSYMVSVVWGETPRVVITLCHPPEWDIKLLTTQFFSLDALEDAMVYADELAQVTGRESVKGTASVLNRSVEHTVHEAEILEWDWKADSLRRTATAMAVEANRFLKNNPKWTDKIAASLVSAVDASFEEVRKSNHILGVFGNPAPWLAQTSEVWKRCGRRTSVFNTSTASFSDLALERAFSHEAEQPIAISPMP